MKRQNGIDLFRLIGAFFIMLLHSSFGNMSQEVSDNLRLCARWAVPFFFITSGFFLAPKIENRKRLDLLKIQKNLSQLISILIISNLIYLGINLSMGRYIYSVDLLLNGASIHLWFIGSLMVGYISIWYAYYIGKSKLLIFVSVVLILGALVTDSYDLFLKKRIDFDLFRFLLSIPFMSIGIYIAGKKYCYKHIKYFVGLLLVGFIIQLSEVFYFEKYFSYNRFNHQFLIGTIILVIPIFILSTVIKVRKTIFTQWGQKHSLFIYLYHPIIYLFLLPVLKTLFPEIHGYIEMFLPVLGFIITLSIAILLNNVYKPLYDILNGDFKIQQPLPVLVNIKSQKADS